MIFTLESERLILRPLETEDFDGLKAVLGDPDNMRYYPSPFDDDKIRTWVCWNRKSYEAHGCGLWAVIRKEDGLFLGDCGITRQEIEGEFLPELGYHIRRDSQGCGYATEACRLCLDYAFNVLELPELYTYTTVENLPSRRVAEKNGMTFVRLFSKVFEGVSIDEVLYSLTRSSFLEKKQIEESFFS